MFKSYYLTFILLFLLSNNSIFSQNYTIPGKVLIDGESKQGHFSENLKKNTKSLLFKFSENNEVINLFNLENVFFEIDGYSNRCKIINGDGHILPVVILIEGRASLYEDLRSEKYFMENKILNIKPKKLEDLKISKSKNRNIGILSKIFEDCISVRSRLEWQNIYLSSIIKLTNDYNNCAEYSEYFELTVKQKREQDYLMKKGVYSIDIGGSLAFNSFNNTIPVLNDERFHDESFKNNVLSYGAIISFNASPSYFKGLRDKFFIDLSISYYNTSEFQVDIYDIKRSSFLFSLSPTLYFLRDKKINPFCRLNFGLNNTDYELTLNDNLTLNEEAFYRDAAGKKSSFVIGFETGFQFNRQFELTLLYQPKSNEEYILYLNRTLEIDNSIVALKASYIISLNRD